jgi:hypothetical protein
MLMQPSREISGKLVLVIRNLICRCVEEARSVPYILRREEAVDLLLRNPDRFQKLVEQERLDRAEYSMDTLTAKLDALEELGQFEALGACDTSLYGRSESDSDLSPAIEQINQLTRTFSVYISNTVTLFEKEFELFTQKLHDLLGRSGMALQVVEFTEEDLAELEKGAETYLASGRLLEAFVFERLISCHVITKQVVGLPSGYSLGEKLIRSATRDAGLSSKMIRFILRASYISQGGWNDLFAMLVRIVDGEPQPRTVLTDFIEQDAIFACNLLCGTFSDLKHQNPDDRRAAIEKALEGWSGKSSHA